jgi:hypothetical protein
MPAIGATTISSLIAGNVRFKEAAKSPSTAEIGALLPFATRTVEVADDQKRT